MREIEIFFRICYRKIIWIRIVIMFCIILGRKCFVWQINKDIQIIRIFVNLLKSIIVSEIGLKYWCFYKHKKSHFTINYRAKNVYFQSINSSKPQSVENTVATYNSSNFNASTNFTNPNNLTKPLSNASYASNPSNTHNSCTSIK